MAEYIVSDQMREWGKCNGYNVDEHYEYFVDYCANKPGKPYKDMDAAFRNCVRADWGGIRRAKRVNPMVMPVKREPEPSRTTGRTVNGAIWVPATATTDGYWKRT